MKLNLDEKLIEMDKSKLKIINKSNLGEPKTNNEIDEIIKNTKIYNFLKVLEEARQWMHKNFNEIETIKELLEKLPQGFVLIDLANKVYKVLKIEKEIKTIESNAYANIENIFNFLTFLKEINLPSYFLFETTDLTENKDILKVIYCLHGLALHLEKEGIKGIEQTKKEFTDEEKNLINSLEIEIKMSKINEIKSLGERSEKQVKDEISIESLEPEEKSFSDDENLLIKKETEPEVTQEDLLDLNPLINLVKTLAWKKSFDNLLYNEKISISNLKRFLEILKIKPKFSLKKNLLEKYKKLYKTQSQINEIQQNIFLILENQSHLRNVSVKEKIKFNDYDCIKKIFNMMLKDYDLLINLFNIKFPIKILFPDNLTGDFYFCKFLLEKIKSDQVKGIALEHFMNSKIYSKILEFLTSLNINLDREKINDQNYIKSFCVIVKDSVKRLNEYLNKVDLPFYCHFFKNKFELFIRPCIINSESFIISEFINTEPAGVSCSGFEGMAEWSDFLKSLNLKLEVSLEDKFYSSIDDINSYFIEYIDYSESIKINLNLEQLNKIIILLKENKKILGKDIKDKLRKIKLFNKKPKDIHKMTIKNKDYPKSKRVELIDFKKKMKAEEMNESYISSDFTLDLDPNAFYNFNNTALDSMITEVKNKVIFLIKETEKKDLNEILFSTEKTRSSKIKENLIEDLEFLESKGIAFKNNNYNEILEMIIEDIKLGKNLVQENTNEGTRVPENVLDSDIDNILQANIFSLEKKMGFLYEYIKDLGKVIFMNKSSFFNSQSEPKTVYGTYTYSLGLFNPVLYEDLSMKNLESKIMCNEVFVFNLFVIFKGNVISSMEIALYDLLRLKNENIEVFDFNNIMGINTQAMLSIINEQYIKY